jgi:general secretion pathway protein M
MIASHPIDRYLARYARAAAVIYVALVTVCVLTALFALLDVAERYRALNASAEVLARFDRRAPSLSSESFWATDSIPTGSPFLEGQTVTVASAALLQQITAAITGVGGRVVSSEVAPQGERSRSAFVRIIANCELGQEALQPLLYGIEAGMPFLFIDQFVAEGPVAGNEGGRMHVLLGVSGLWLQAK